MSFFLGSQIATKATGVEAAKKSAQSARIELIVTRAPVRVCALPDSQAAAAKTVSRAQMGLALGRHSQRGCTERGWKTHRALLML